MSYVNLRKLVTKHEGRRASVYQDSEGYWTIGVGHLVDRRKGGGLPEPIIDALLDHDLATTTNELLAKLPWVENLDDVRLAVLIDMAFNLGVPGLLGFSRTLAHVRDGDYQQASEEMLRSRWAEQVGYRATELSLMMRDGVWPPGISSEA